MFSSLMTRLGGPLRLDYQERETVILAVFGPEQAKWPKLAFAGDHSAAGSRNVTVAIIVEIMYVYT